MGCFQIYTGNGKGKTTAALGLAVRALGCGFKVKFIQFLKVDGCGEHVSLERLGCSIDCGERISQPPWIAEAAELWRGHTRVQLDKARLAISGDYDLIVLDELLGAMRKGFVTLEEAKELVAARQDGAELLITGRDAPPELIAIADLVTEMTPVKHYIDKGIGARRGIEY